MKNLIQNTKFEMNSERTGLKQSVRNKLKADAMGKLQDMLVEMLGADGNEIMVERVADGVAVSMYNEPLNENISFVLDMTFKNFEYDIDFENQMYNEEVEEKRLKAEKKAKAKASKIAKDKAERERKKLEKEIQKKVANGEMTMKQVEALVEM